jgi:hypothetical protein
MEKVIVIKDLFFGKGNTTSIDIGFGGSKF